MGFLGKSSSRATTKRNSGKRSLQIESLENRELLSVNIGAASGYAQTDNPAVFSFEVSSSETGKSTNIYLEAVSDSESELAFSSIALIDATGKSIGLKDFALKDSGNAYAVFTVASGTYKAYVYAGSGTSGNFSLDISGDTFSSKLDILVEAALFQAQAAEGSPELWENNKEAYATPDSEKYLGDAYPGAIENGEVVDNLFDIFKDEVDLNGNGEIDTNDLTKARNLVKLGNAELVDGITVLPQDLIPPNIAFTLEYGNDAAKTPILTILVTDFNGVKSDSVKYSLTGDPGNTTALDLNLGGKISLSTDVFKEFGAFSITVWATDNRGNTGSETYEFTWLDADAPSNLSVPVPVVPGSSVQVPELDTDYSYTMIGDLVLDELEPNSPETVCDQAGFPVGALELKDGEFVFTPDEDYFNGKLVPGETVSCVFDVTINAGYASYVTTLTFLVQKPAASVYTKPTLDDETPVSGKQTEGGVGKILADTIAGKWFCPDAAPGATPLVVDLVFHSVVVGSASGKYEAGVDYLKYVSVAADGSVLFDARDEFFTELGLGETLTITFGYKIFDGNGKSEEVGLLKFTVEGADQPSVVTIEKTRFEIASNNQVTPTRGGEFGTVSFSDPDAIDQNGYTYSDGNVRINGVENLPADLVKVIYGEGVPVSFTVDTSKLPNRDSVSELTFDIIFTSISGGTATQTITVVCTPEAAPVVNPVAWSDLNQDDDASTDLPDGYDFSGLRLAEGSLPDDVEFENLFALTEAGELTFTPGENLKYLREGETLVLKLEYTVTDSVSGLIGTGVVNVTITGSNDAPTFIPGAAIEGDAGTEIVIDCLDYFSDAENDTLHVTKINEVPIVRGSADVPGFGTFFYDHATQKLYFTPDPASSTQEMEITLTVSDGKASADGTITVNVTEIAKPPVVEPIERADLNQDDDDLINLPGDYDLSDLRLAEGLLPNGVGLGDLFAFTEEGKLTFTPRENLKYLRENETLVLKLEYTATDRVSGLSGIGVINVTITGSNDAPTFTPGEEIKGDAGTEIVIDWLDYFSDAENDTLHVMEINEVPIVRGSADVPGFGTFFYDHATQKLYFTPDPASSTQEMEIVLTVSDGKASADGTITVSVSKINKIPVVEDQTIETPVNKVKTIDIKDIATDANGDDTLRFVSVTLVNEQGDTVADINGDDVILGGSNLSATLKSGTTVTLTDCTLTIDGTAHESLALGETETLIFTVVVVDADEEEGTGQITVVLNGIMAPKPGVEEHSIDLLETGTDSETVTLDGQITDTSGGVERTDDWYDITWLGLTTISLNDDNVSITGDWLTRLNGFFSYDNGEVTFDAPADYFAFLKDGEELTLTFSYIVTDKTYLTSAQGNIIVTINGEATAATAPTDPIDLGSTVETKGEMTFTINVAEDIFGRWTTPEGTPEASGFKITDALCDETVSAEIAAEIAAYLTGLTLEEGGKTVTISTEESSALQKLGLGQSVTVTVEYEVSGKKYELTFVIEGANDDPVVSARTSQFVVKKYFAMTPRNPNWNVTDPDSNHDGNFAYTISGIMKDGEPLETNPGFTIDSDGMISITDAKLKKTEAGIYKLTILISDLAGGKTSHVITITVKDPSAPTVEESIIKLTVDEYESDPDKYSINLNDYISTVDNLEYTFSKNVTYVTAESDAWPAGVVRSDVYSFDATTGVFTFNPNGKFELIPEDGRRTYTFTCTVSLKDYPAFKTIMTFTVTVEGENSAPRLKKETDPGNVTVNQGGKANANILSKWTDPDGDTISMLPDSTIMDIEGITGKSLISDENSEEDEYEDLDAEILDSFRDLLRTKENLLTYDEALGRFTFDASDALWKQLGIGQSVTITVNYSVSDGEIPVSGSFTITVNGDNDKPVIENLTGIQSYLANNREYTEDVALATCTATDIDWNDEGKLTYIISEVTLDGDTFGWNTDAENPVFLISGDQVFVNAAAIENLTAGKYVISVKAVDGLGIESTAVKKLTINVGAAPEQDSDTTVELALANENLGKFTSTTGGAGKGFLASGGWREETTTTAPTVSGVTVVGSVVDNNEDTANKINSDTLLGEIEAFFSDPGNYTWTYNKNSDTLTFKVTNESLLKRLGEGQSVTLTISYTVSNSYGVDTGEATLVINGAATGPSFDLDNVFPDAAGTYSLIAVAGTTTLPLVDVSSCKNVDDNKTGTVTLTASVPGGLAKIGSFDAATGELLINDDVPDGDYTLTLTLKDSAGKTTKKTIKIIVTQLTPKALSAVTENEGNFIRNLNVQNIAVNSWGLKKNDVPDAVGVFKVESVGTESISSSLLKELEAAVQNIDLEPNGNVIVLTPDDADWATFQKLGKNQAIRITLECVVTLADGTDTTGYVTLDIKGKTDPPTFELTEEAKGGYVLEESTVAQVIQSPIDWNSISDLDDNDQAGYTCQLVRTDDNPLTGFSINAKTGDIKIAKNTSAGEYTVTIRVKDLHNGYSSTQVITVVVPPPLDGFMIETFGLMSNVAGSNEIVGAGLSEDSSDSFESIPVGLGFALADTMVANNTIVDDSVGESAFDDLSEDWFFDWGLEEIIALPTEK